MKKSGCPFCNIDPYRVFHEGKHVIGVWDGFPVSKGHALLVPRRHVADWFAASSAEKQELMEAVEIARDAILERWEPDGFNVGINIGGAAGQTIMHLHMHVIPRYHGDVEDPTGGVRLVIPDKGNYLKVSEAAVQYESRPIPRIGLAGNNDRLIRSETNPLLQHLIEQLDNATSVDIAVAFVKDSGVRRLLEHFRDLLDREGRLRLLTGDYLELTDPSALHRLLDLDGNIQLRVYECKGSSFHPKAYIFHHPRNQGMAFVGSSNLSAMALGDAVEWNYRVVSSAQSGFSSIVEGFEELFCHRQTRTITNDWIKQYSRRRKPPESKPATIDIEEEEELVVPEPHPVQKEALAALVQTREEGNRAGLIVLATGLGKTWLSAFDSNKPEFSRILFVAHREEILGQAMNTYRRIRPNSNLGRFTGKEKAPDADILFASIQTLGKKRHLSNFDPKAFDYIVVDEFHHAAARTYRQLIDHFEPQFLLGLTATPERTDGGDLLALCGENLVYRIDLTEGVKRQLLCPYHYFGVPDEVDYTNIPWRSSRFDEEALTNALATQKRAENALEQHKKHGGKRTLAFCCSQRHADFMAEFFRASGLEAVAVHAGNTSAPRASSLEKLEEGELDMICAVDMFNEGVDLPNVDTVMMLRPTESRILWLQQFGRGLRRPNEDKVLTVVDYIGNHRTFLLKPLTLLGLPSSDASIEKALNALQAGEQDLPPGCEVTYELEAVEILRALLRKPQTEEVARFFYEDFNQRYGERPTASQAYHEGYSPRSLRRYHGSWYGFIDSMNGLSPEEKAVLDQAGHFLTILESTPMTASYKMILLSAMLDQDAIPGEIGIEALCSAFVKKAARSAQLRVDVGESRMNNPKELRKLLESYPIDVLVKGKGTGGTSFFSYEDEVMSTKISVSGDVRETFRQMVREIVDWRIAEYLDRAHMKSQPDEDRFVCKVSHTDRKPMLFLPDRSKISGIPSGWTEVWANDEKFEANFVTVAVNVMRRPGSEKNAIHEVLRGWFGENAGLPGTRFRVAFEKKADSWTLSPILAAKDGAQVELWQRYSREEVAKAFGLPFKAPIWNQGFVPHKHDIFLFVTLDKADMSTKHQYADRFIDAYRFQWQSQNRTTQASKHGQMIKNHLDKGISIHLLVRPTQREATRTSPFFYCGKLQFESWEGEKPISVKYRLLEPLPDSMWNLMKLQ